MRCFFLFFTLLLSTLLFSQIDLENRVFYDQFSSSKIPEKTTGDTPLANVQGSPYANQEFIEGTVEMKGGQVFKNIPLRYNIYKDKMEFEKDDVAYEIIESNRIKKVKIDAETYVYQPYYRNGKIEIGFFALHNESNIKLLEKKNTVFNLGEKATGYMEAKPSSFSKAPSIYYLKFQDQPAVEIKRKKHIAKLFPLHQSKIAEYVKKHKVSTKDTEALKKLLSYYEQLCEE